MNCWKAMDSKIELTLVFYVLCNQKKKKRNVDSALPMVVYVFVGRSKASSFGDNSSNINGPFGYLTPFGQLLFLLWDLAIHKFL